MNHIAIDLGGRKSQLCVVSEKGEILEEGPAVTASLEDLLKELPPSRVILETCAEAFTVADRARRAGQIPVVVPATLAPALGVGSRGMKNDQRDARHLGIASCRMQQLPSVHIPSVEAREMKSLCAIREGLVSSRAQLVHGTRGWLRGLALGPMANGAVETFVVRIRRDLKAHEVESYFGLTPEEDSSSERKRITSITKAGSTRVRWTLVQAAWAACRSKGDHPMVQ